MRQWWNGYTRSVEGAIVIMAMRVRISPGALMATRKCEDCKAEEATFKVASPTLEKLIGDRCIRAYAMSLAFAVTNYPAARPRRELVKGKR